MTRCDLCKKKIQEGEEISTKNFVLCDKCFREIGKQYKKQEML